MSEPLVGEALFAFREANGLRHDEHLTRLWRLRIDFMTLYLPNFAWRRRAIAAHDTHHMLTGYPCTVRGELQIAAWEFGAGRYPHWGATLFCLPFAIAGMLFLPGATWAAYRRGRREHSLYRAGVADRVAELPLRAARTVLSGQSPA